MNIQRTEYFSRQVTIPQVGERGLRRLQSSRVAIVGIGGVGSSAAYYLSKSGVAQLRLIDQDIIETSNLPRITGAEFSDLYRPKAEVVAEKLNIHDGWSTSEPIVETLTEKNAQELLQGTQIILDGLDNFRTRYILNRLAAKTRTPYLFASSVSNQAHLTLFNPPQTACMECAMPGVKDRSEESCETLGVTPTIVGLTGALAADTTLRYLQGLPTILANRILTIDMEGPDFFLTGLSKRTECTVCNARGNTEPEISTAVSLLCGERTANVQPSSKQRLNLKTLACRISPQRLLATSNSVLVFRKDLHTISLFSTGRMIISNIENEEEAKMVSRDVQKELVDKYAEILPN